MADTTVGARNRDPDSHHLIAMPQGDKSSYTAKQKRKAAHIEESYEQRGVSPKTAKARAWATVNKQDHGGKKTGSGRTRKPGAPSRRSGSRISAARRKAKQ